MRRLHNRSSRPVEMAPQFQKSKLPTLLLPVELKACYKLKCAARSSTEEDRVSELETVADEDNDAKVHRNGSPIQSQRTSAFSGDALSLGICKPVYEVVEVKSIGVVAKRKINRRQLLKSSGLRPRDIRSVDPSLFLTNSVPSILDIRGNDVSLNEYKGKVLLIVNVASKCGLTNSNYKELNILYEKYKNKGFEILAFPCNQFGGQEPGTNKEIQETACTLFKVEFPIFDKVDVNRKNSAPLYKFLKTQKGGFLGDAIKWNFTKFLVDKEGKVVERYAPTTSPLKIEKNIQNLL